VQAITSSKIARLAKSVWHGKQLQGLKQEKQFDFVPHLIQKRDHFG
jgi:hypothetical protein